MAAANNERFAAWVRRGLPPEPLVERRLQFDATTRTLVLHGAASRRGALPQLYFRKLGQPTYSSVSDIFRTWAGSRENQVSIQAETTVRTFVLVGSGSLVCLISQTRGPIAMDEGTPLYDCGLLKIGLSDSRCDLWPDLIFDGASCFVVELIGSDGDSDTFYAVVGVPSPGRIGPVGFHVAKLTWSSRGIEILAPHEDVVC